MKIAHLTTVDLSLRYLVLPQLEAARDLGEVIGISASGPFVPELEERGIRHVSLPSSTRGMSPIADIRAMRQLWLALRAENPDILHTHNPKPGLYGRVLGRLAGVPLVVNTVHGLYATEDSPWLKRMLVYLLEAVASRFSHAELVQNPEDLELLRSWRIAPASKLRLLGNGVDLGKFNPERVGASRNRTREDLGIANDEIAVGLVGRLVAEKGIPELLEAARLLDENVKVFVAGPSDPDKTDALVTEDGSVDRVEFLGMRRDVDALYGAFDVFVLPSHREGFPRAAMEAAACGLPLVLTDIRGCRQVVEPGVNGFLVPVADPQQLAEAITRLVGDARLRSQMGAASAAKARREFDERSVVDIVMDTYRSLADREGLGWETVRAGSHEIKIRPASPEDAPAISQLHRRRIETGFLSSLGPGFLRLLYQALIHSTHGSVIVAESEDEVVGFIAGTADTNAFYREFLRRHVLGALLRLVPALFRVSTWRRIWETLRYGGDGGEVSAELLSMAVAPGVSRSGLGQQLVRALLHWAEEEGMGEMKVVVGADNAAAITLYCKMGFGTPRPYEVHRGVESLVMKWQL